ncbi:MAG: cobalt transporter [Leptolyngbyaceae cyanobacterium CAN_BIN12]|nr:cobalt transporter [Leptolyngbyaceae cyanobacterium CAN_BIN12]
MKPLPLVSSILAVSLAISTPTIVFAHVGHGDEFQSTGGTQKVQVNAQTDQMLGITVMSIAPAAGGGTAVMIPVTALVDADGKQLAFVQYENFYEPVEITTGATKGELIEVTKGLSVGEKLVTQGSLSLYAESRKTQPAASPVAAVSPQNANNHAQADAQGIPHSHDASGNMAQKPGDAAQQSSSFPISTLAAIGGGAVLLAGGAIAVVSTRKKKSAFSNKKGGY